MQESKICVIGGTHYIQLGDGKLLDCYGSVFSLSHNVGTPADVPELEEAVNKWGDLTNFPHRPRNRDFYATESTWPFASSILSPLLYPTVVVENGNVMLEVTLNRKDLDRGRRTKMKPGKVLRMLLPMRDNIIIEKMVDELKESFAERHYDLFVCGSQESFRKAYEHKIAKTYNFPTTTFSKNLGNSCMHGQFSSSAHPAEVYASGDFEIVWLEDKDGNIAGRTIVHKDSKTSGPVYGVCAQAIEKLHQHLEDRELQVTQGDAWEGAKLLAIREGSMVVGPYLDNGFGVVDHGEYLTMTEGYADYSADNTSGYLTSGSCCEACGYQVSEDDVCISPDGAHFCYDCFNETFVFSEYLDEYIETDDAQLVIDEYDHEVWVDRYTLNRHFLYCEYTDQYIHRDRAYNDFHGDPVYAKHAEYEMAYNEECDYWMERSDAVEHGGDWFHKEDPLLEKLLKEEEEDA